jgi:hypothetical protein
MQAVGERDVNSIDVGGLHDVLVVGAHPHAGEIHRCHTVDRLARGGRTGEPVRAENVIQCRSAGLSSREVGR